MDMLMDNTHYLIELEGTYLSDFDFKPVIESVEDQINDGVSNFVIDLANLKFMNSTGLGALIRILTKARTAGGEAILVNSSTQISQLLLMTKLNQVFNNFDSLEDAIKHFNISNN
jgi:anti-sigma B factor antagonist